MMRDRTDSGDFYDPEDNEMTRMQRDFEHEIEKADYLYDNGKEAELWALLRKPPEDEMTERQKELAAEARAEKRRKLEAMMAEISEYYRGMK